MGISKNRTTKAKFKQKITIKHVIKRVLFFVYFVILTTFISFHLYYADRILPNTYVNSTYVGNMTSSEALDILKRELPIETEVNIKIKDNNYKLATGNIDFRYLPISTVRKAFDLGRSGSFTNDIKIKLLSFLNTSHLRPEYQYSEDSLKSFVSLAGVNSITKFREPYFEYENSRVAIKEGTVGESIDESEISADIINSFVQGKDSEIIATINKVEPSLRAVDLSDSKIKLETILTKDYSLSFDDKEWKLEKTEVAHLLKPIRSGMEVKLSLNRSLALDKLNTLAKEIDRNPKSQVLEVKDNKVVKFSAPENGQRVKIKESYEAFERGLLAENPKILLAVEVTLPPKTENEYRISDVLGVGKSKFKGSDSSRVHNIETAVNKVNGVLVAPGEVYSFIKAVGPIDRANGFASAKVISGGRTVLGDGGGVCQVSTTVFRAALEAGLPIIERNAHAYRVGYYEQESAPGIDATIYSPSVDLQFKNDTSGYILVAAELDKSNYALEFTIYGKKDGRVTEITKPKVSNVIPAPAVQYIDDPTLPKGQRKQLEYSVSGATVEFSRIVKKDNAILYDDTFKSRYRAWGAIYAVGTKE